MTPCTISYNVIAVIQKFGWHWSGKMVFTLEQQDGKVFKVPAPEETGRICGKHMCYVIKQMLDFSLLKSPTYKLTIKFIIHSYINVSDIAISRKTDDFSGHRLRDPNQEHQLCILQTRITNQGRENFVSRVLLACIGALMHWLKEANLHKSEL